MSCVDLTIMDRSAHRALPSPYSKIFPAFGAGAASTHAAGWVENASSTSANHTPASAHLYCSMVRNALQPASSTDLACRVFTRAEAFTLTTKSAPLAFSVSRGEIE
jgi:hypothetical protein